MTRRTIGTLLALLPLFLFVYIDFAQPNALPFSARFKFCALLACMLCLPRQGHMLLRTALGLTVLCDILLLFSPYHLAGVLLFIPVQILHALRHARMADIRPIVLIFAALAAVAGAAAALYISSDWLFAAGAAYAVFLLTGTVLAILSLLRRRCPLRQSAFCAAGMLLFVGCDVLVMTSNLFAVGSQYIWLFYLPSQWLLANSTADRSE